MLKGSSHRRGLFRALRTIVAAAVVGLSFYYLGTSIATGAAEADFKVLRSHWPLVLLCGLLTEVAVLLGALSYHLVLRGIGSPLGLGRSARIHLLSNLAKYIPGYAWQYVGKAYLSKQEQVTLRNAGAAVVLELGFVVGTGLLVGVGTFTPRWPWAASLEIPPAYQIVAALLVVMALLASPEVLRRVASLAREKGKAKWAIDVERQPLWAAMGVISLGWALFGVAFFYLARAFHPIPVEDLRTCIFSLVGSFLFSFAVPLVPGGIGIREGAMAYLLSPIMPRPLASLVAIVMRLVLVVCEGLGALIVWLVAWRKDRIPLRGY